MRLASYGVDVFREMKLLIYCNPFIRQRNSDNLTIWWFPMK